MLTWDVVRDVPSTRELRMVAAVVAASGLRNPSVVVLIARAMDYFWGLWEQELRHINQHLELDPTLPSWLISSFRHSQRQELVLINYSMLPIHGRLIGEGMNDFSRLQRMVLMDNGFGDEGARGISVGLGRDSALSEVVLVRCHVGNAGATALANALMSNKCLRVLQLEENLIGDVGANAFAAALQHNRSLNQLLLGGNYIGETSKARLAEVRTCQVSTSCRFFSQQSGQPPAEPAVRYPPNEYRFTPGCFKVERQRKVRRR